MQSICIYYSIFLSIIYFIFIRKKREKVEWKIQNLNFFALFLHSFINLNIVLKYILVTNIFSHEKISRPSLIIFISHFIQNFSQYPYRQKQKTSKLVCLSLKFSLKTILFYISFYLYHLIYLVCSLDIFYQNIALELFLFPSSLTFHKLDKVFQ